MKEKILYRFRNNYFNNGENLFNTCLNNNGIIDNTDSSICGKSITEYNGARDNYLNALRTGNNYNIIPCYEYCQINQADYESCVRENCDGAFLSVNKILE